MLDEGVKTNILLNLGYDEDEPEKYDSFVERIKKMSETEALERYLAWNGIIGYASDFIKALDSIRAAKM